MKRRNWLLGILGLGVTAIVNLLPGKVQAKEDVIGPDDDIWIPIRPKAATRSLPSATTLSDPGTEQFIDLSSKMNRSYRMSRYKEYERLRNIPEIESAFKEIEGSENRRVFYIDMAGQPPEKVELTLEKLKDAFRKRKISDSL